ncbi:MAG TPA: GtrA family protein [Nocardioides sp.]|nr:GtrA family protein [Nocardioides sp.]
MGIRWQRLLAEVGRFLAVGGVATLVALFLFNLLVHGFNTAHRALLDDHVILAYVIANAVGMVISYRGSRSWAFRDRPPRQADGGRLAFLAINVVTMTLPIACLWLSRNVLGRDDPISDNISANVIGLFLGLVARFYLFRTFVFRRPVHIPHLTLPRNPLGGPTPPVIETTDPSTSGPAQPPAP